MMIEQTQLFKNGEGGYRAYNAPALTRSVKGTMLAFCEARNSDPTVMGGDSGDIDIGLRRSFDSGRTWEPMQIVVRTGPDTDGNPAPVVDKDTGTIWLVFCQNFADGPENLIVEGKAPRTVWVTSSKDDGVTWDTPREITDEVKDPSWTWYATGPGGGIQLSSGRLVIPCDHVQGVAGGYQDVASSVATLAGFGHSHIIYSDDHGEHWHIGGVAQAGTNESKVVQTIDGALYLNCRNYVGDHQRAYAWSYDDGTSFTESGWDETLPEPICNAGLTRFTDENSHDRNRVLFSNPASKSRRERLTVRISYDECRTWNTGKVLHEDHSSYSDICAAPDMSICCLYDWGYGSGYDGLTLARFDLKWLTDGADTLA